MTERLYYAESYLTSFDADVLGLRSIGEAVGVVLSRTAFYPTSGGQPHDTGTLDGAQVIDVVEEGAMVVHLVTHPVEGHVHGTIDWPRRFDHMQQHTGQHILSQAALRTLGAQTRAVHFGTTAATLDLDRADLTGADVEALEDLANGIVFEDRPVGVREVDEAELPALGLRRPAKKEGRIRIVEVEDFDRSACGGTHVRRTGEVGGVKVRRWERHRGGVRLEFLCGWRALREYRRTQKLIADLAAAFTVADGEVPDAAARLSARLRDAERAIADLQDRLLGREAADLLASSTGIPRVIAVALPRDADEVVLLAGKIVAVSSAVAILGAADGRLVVARSADLAIDAGAVLRRTVDRFGGRGGGRPAFAQGAVPAAAIAEAVEAARSAVGDVLAAAGG
ncbi:MAG TPA: alanyl-tRNA editing protein [bacterium]